MQTVALIDYDSGNIHSASRALVAASEALGGGHQIVLTADPDVVKNADRIVLPGVGHYQQCKSALEAKDGLVAALEQSVVRGKKPFLGICVGMQLLADFGAEDGNTPGLGWVHGAVMPLQPGGGLSVPHMGWNELHLHMDHPLLANLGDSPHAYFVHSYGFLPEDEGVISATCEYGRTVVAAVAHENVFGTQFHPEKSQAVGLRILTNFLSWKP